MALLPQKHFDSLMKLRYLNPKVVYDIGACVLHWTNKAQLVWPDAKFVAFEAMNECEFLYQEKGIPYVAGALLYHTDNVDLEFYQNLEHPGGNSIYKENEKLSPDAKFLFSEDKKIIKKGMKLDTLVEMFKLPKPELIKMDIQGAELDALKGATECLKTTKYLILELQKEEYNLNAPKLDEVTAYLKKLGFSRHGIIHAGKFDSDYFFVQDRLVDHA
jgi:FkbM family methyltransferase